MEDEKNKNIDFSELLRGLDNKWVILSENSTEILAAADDLDDINDELTEGVIMKVPDSKSYFASYITHCGSE